MTRRVALACTAIAVMGCGGDSTAPPPPFPAVAGTYAVNIIFAAFPPSVANGTGTITLTQASRNVGTLGGSASILLVIGTTSTQLTQLSNPTVTEAGVIRFQLPPPNVTTTWGFDGTFPAGNRSIAGTHLLLGTTTTQAGTWTATRQ